MDAVELPLPAAVAVSKLLTAEGFGRAGVSVVEAEARESKANVSIFRSSLVTGCGTSRSDVTCAVTSSEQTSVSRNIKADVELLTHEGPLPNLGTENTAKQLMFRDVNNSLFLLPKCTGKQLQRKTGKASSISPCSKRPKREQVEDSMSQAGPDDSNVTSLKHGSNLTKCTSEEKSRVVRQKHSLDGKRGDKRNLKAPMKTKFDSCFSKVGFLSTNSAAGGHNILGIYGLKSDIHDVTKHVDELSLNDLLDGSYKYPSLCQDKGKKAANTNENILQSVRKACSILQLRGPLQPRNAVELDSSSSRKMDKCLLSYGSSITSGTDCGKGDDYTADLASSSKDSCSKPGAPTGSNTFLLYQPNDILERLALPPAKDLNFLLLDTSKPAVSSRSTPDPRSGKPISHGASLSPFPWSHSSGPCKTLVDTAKLYTNRSTCQGSRWVRIGSTVSSLGDSPSCFSDLESLAYDHNVVSSGQIKPGLYVNEKSPSASFRLPYYEQVSSSSAACHLTSCVPDKTFLKVSDALSSHHSLGLSLPQRCLDSLDAQLKFDFNMGIFLKTPEAEAKMTHRENDAVLAGPSPNNLQFQENEDNYIQKEESKRRNNGGSTDSSCYSPFKCSIGGYNQPQWQLHTPENSIQAGYSPRLLAAAQTLYEIARHSGMQHQNNGKIRWPKKPSQKAMKARKSTSSTGKTEVTSVTPKSVMGLEEPVKISNQIIPSKKSRFSTTDKKKDIGHTNNVGTGLMKWSTPTSSRSSPSRSERDSVADSKQSNVDTVKLLGMMPSSTRVLDKACNNQQKQRKVVLMDWGRGRSKKE